MKTMDVQSEVSTRLKIYLLFFVVLLVGTMTYFVIRQNSDLGTIYAATDDVTVVRPHSFLPQTNVDTTSVAP